MEKMIGKLHGNQELILGVCIDIDHVMKYIVISKYTVDSFPFYRWIGPSLIKVI